MAANGGSEGRTSSEYRMGGRGNEQQQHEGEYGNDKPHIRTGREIRWCDSGRHHPELLFATVDIDSVIVMGRDCAIHGSCVIARGDYRCNVAFQFARQPAPRQQNHCNQRENQQAGRCALRLQCTPHYRQMA